MESQDLVKAELEADMMLDGEPEKETLPAQAEDDARGDAEVDMEVDRPDGDSEREKPHHEKKRHHHHRDGKGREKEKEKDATPIMNLLYMPGGSLPHPLRLVGKVVDIRIPAKYLTTKNREVATRQVWGTDVYTEDSDIVAVIMHTGKFPIRSALPSRVAGLSALVRILPGSSDYRGTVRHGMMSRNWGPRVAKCSLQLIRVQIVMNEQLDPSHLKPMEGVEKRASRQPAMRLLHKRKLAPHVTIIFDSHNEPCIKYCLGLVVDRGMDEQHWLSSRLRRECMYLGAPGNAGVRYELRCLASSSQDSSDKYQFAQIIDTPGQPRAEKSDSTPVPLPPSMVKVLAANLDWDEVEWSDSGVSVKDHHYPILTVQFKRITAQ